MRYPPILAAALAAAVLATPVAAQSVAVKYNDLDLSNSADQAKLERRIDRAARDVCGMDEHTVGSRIPSDEAKRCYAQAKSQFAEQVAAAVARGNDRG